MNIVSILKKFYLNLINDNVTYTSQDLGEIYYVNGSEDLPAPLGPEEEEEYIKRLANNDDYAKQVLVEHNLRLVVYIAKKFNNSNVGIEDLVSIGTIGLMKAITTFKPDKNIKLATYASRCIENEILMYLRRNTKLKSEVSIDEPLNKESQGIEEEVDKNLLKISISKLNEKEKQIMELRFGLKSGKEKTQKEVADMLGISQSYISRIEKRIIQKMRKEILSKT